MQILKKTKTHFCIATHITERVAGTWSVVRSVTRLDTPVVGSSTLYWWLRPELREGEWTEAGITMLQRFQPKYVRDFEGVCAPELTFTVWCGSSWFLCGSLRFKVSKKKVQKMPLHAKIC